MNLIIVHKNKDLPAGDNDSLLRFAISSEPLAGVVLDGLSKGLSWGQSSVSALRRFAKRAHAGTICAVPEGWGIEPHTTQTAHIMPYAGKVPIRSQSVRKAKRNSWFVVSDGRFVTHINNDLLANILATTQVDVVAVNAESELLAAREKIRLTVQGKVAGFRRLYDDSAELAPLPLDWPHHLFVKTNILDQVLDDWALPESFSSVLERCRSHGLTLQAVNVAGLALDLETEDGLLNFCRAGVRSSPCGSYTRIAQGSCNPAVVHNREADREPRLVGKILLGKNVRIGSDVVIVGPTIIGNNVRIERGSVINSSIIGPQVHIPQGQMLQNCIVKGPQYCGKDPTGSKSCISTQVSSHKVEFGRREFTSDIFRSWGIFSYAGRFKRMVDFLAAVIVLALFAPITPFIALAIKLNSPGPVFYKDKRQGLHGRAFNCWKFRTMHTGSESIQEKLRVVSQVDGPQFKIKDDPRISTVGRFLRDTYIDEIPQFLNVLLGQMSVVGPRPSPESENTLCPSWRDARLSVRPGITGLWQVYRTRKPEQDFQEWIYYDTEYVRRLSLRTDLRICWRTIKKMVRSFISQF
ncbi:MAG: sugar transferase [Planctomycetes bacterium]|nr:sugar transferase [Planctomycetota bacterium]